MKRTIAAEIARRFEKVFGTIRKNSAIIRFLFWSNLRSSRSRPWVLSSRGGGGALLLAGGAAGGAVVAGGGAAQGANNGRLTEKVEFEFKLGLLENEKSIVAFLPAECHWR